VLGQLRRPQAEAVVVLGGQDDPAHARLARDARPLAAVELRRREGRFGLLARAPFLAVNVFMLKCTNA
jgi:hypothetical protein